TAVSAQVRRRGLGRAQRRRQIERRYYRAEEQPRTQFFIDETCVLREPAEPRVFCSTPLDDRSGVHITPRFEWFGKFLAHRLDQAVELAAKHFVIVIAPGIARNPP